MVIIVFLGYLVNVLGYSYKKVCKMSKKELGRLRLEFDNWCAEEQVCS